MGDTTSAGRGASRARQKGKFIQKMDREKYETLVQLSKGTFHVPKSKRTNCQKSAVRQFQRRREYFKVEGEELFFNGMQVIPVDELSKKVKEAYRDTLGSGCKSTWRKVQNKCAGVPRRTVETVLGKSSTYQVNRPTFSNKVPPKPVTAARVNERWQVDLMVMDKDEVVMHGHTYKYILSVLDVFSRFLILRPLTRKSSKCVSKAFQTILAEHGNPDIVQSDNGTEFKGSFKRLLLKRGIKHIRSRPYHPQSQGKVERCHLEVRKKIAFACSQKGFNWAKKIHKVQEAVNNVTKEVLANMTPAEVKAQQGNRALMRTVATASSRFSARMVARHKGSCAIYRKGEQVLLKYPEIKKGKVPPKRVILKGVVVERNLKDSKYKIKFQTQKGELCKWVCVTNITSRTKVSEIQNRRRKVTEEQKMDRQQHRRQYNLPYTPTDRADDFQQLGMKVLLDPREVVGNCQFEAAAHQMSLIGNFQTGVDLRRQAVNHIAENLLSYETFITGDPEQYLSQMSRSSTYGDHVTLQALSRIHNVQILIASARGAEYSVLVSPDGSYSHQRFLLTLGHYPEGMGEHYVSLDLDETRASVLWWATRSHHDDRGSGCDEGGGGGDEEDDGCDEDDGYDEVDDGRDEGGDGCDEGDGGCEEVDDGRDEGGDGCDEGDGGCEEVDDGCDEGGDGCDEGDGGCEEVDDGCDEGDGELGMGDVDYCMSEGHEFLPREIQARIVHFALQSSPASRFTLQRVSRFFYDVVSRVPPPRLHISTTLLPRLPNPVSVRRLVQAAGRGSGLAIAIQRILATSQWYNAWLWLRPEEFDWYSVINVYYRNRNIH